MKNEESRLRTEQTADGQARAERARSHRRLFRFFVLPVSFFICGCLGLNSGNKTPPPPPASRISQTPTKEDLIGYLDQRAQRANAIEASDLHMDITAPGESVGVSGKLFCQQPRNFRLKAKLAVVGKEVADIGSNDQEFWYWVSEDKPPDLYHCSYADLARGVRLPFPVQPEWVMETLGMARYDDSRPNFRLENFTVETRGRTFELIEQTTSSQGQPVRKVTVFNDHNTGGSTPQVTAIRLYDSSNKLMCQATIGSVQRDPRDPVTGYVIPNKLLLEWPAQKLKLALTLDSLGVNRPETDIARNSKLFTRPDGHRSVDLARRSYDNPPLSLQRTSGFSR